MSNKRYLHKLYHEDGTLNKVLDSSLIVSIHLYYPNLSDKDKAKIYKAYHQLAKLEWKNWKNTTILQGGNV